MEINMSKIKPMIVPAKKCFLILSLGVCLTAPNLAAADSATLCVGPWFGVPKRVIFSGSCPKGEIAVPLSSGGKSFDYKVGDTGPGGGVVFFVDYHDDYPGFDYLEAAPADIGPYAWCDNTNTSIPAVNGWAANAVGAGQANTTAMLQVCTSGAAVVADNYSSNGQNDWFLPSEGELMLMYTNLRQAGKGALGYALYWSSTDYDANLAWSQDFYSGNQNVTLKINPFSVRPVRAF